MPQVKPLFSLGILILLAGCSDSRDARVYEVAKEDAPPPPEEPANAPMAPFAANEGVQPDAPAGTGDMASRRLPEEALNQGGENPDWTVPAGWNASEGSAMRRASFAADGPGGPVDIAVTSFPGDVGGLAANINRWRRQIGLSPLGPGEVEGAVTRKPVAGKEVVLCRMEGETQATIAAIFEHDGNSWFLKMSGPRSSVAANAESFTQFVETVRFP